MTLLAEFRDPEVDVLGWLAVDRLERGVCAGGLRIAEDVDAGQLAGLAATMTRKQSAYGIEVGGAKAGLRMRPDHPARPRVLRRFLTAMRTAIEKVWSVGPDVGTTLPELEALGREIGLPCLKIAVGRSRGIEDGEFLRRYNLLEQEVGGWTVNQLRGAAAVKVAALVGLARCGIAARGARVAVQGAGAMGGGTARLLHAAGCRVVAWADARACHVDERGLDVPALLAERAGGLLPPGGAGPPRALFDAPCDALVLAAVSGAFASGAAAALRCRVVVEAANLALDVAAERACHEAGVLVVPDLLAGAGGSLAVEALYTGVARSGLDVLAHVERRAGAEISAVLEAAAADAVPPRERVRGARRGGSSLAELPAELRGSFAAVGGVGA